MAVYDDYERRVQAELDRLVGADFPATRAAYKKRDATLRALALASVNGQPWTGPDGVLGPKRDTRLVVSENNFYKKKHWWLNPLTREVLQNIIAIYKERTAADMEAARIRRQMWLERKEMEAAEVQFDKASDLLSLPHIAKKTRKDEKTIILDPANAAVFNAAVRLNESASQLARRSLGLPLDVRRSELTGAAGGPISTATDLGEMDDDQLRAHLAALGRAAMAASGGGDGDEDNQQVTPDDPAGEGDE